MCPGARGERESAGGDVREAMRTQGVEGLGGPGRLGVLL